MSNSSQETRYSSWRNKAEKEQTQHNQLYCIWKSFTRSQADLIKSYIGLCLFDIKAGEDPMNIQNYYNCYDQVQKKTINGVFSQLKFENNRIILAHTFLYLSINDAIVCVFRQMRSNDEIHFIDYSGRVYSSWNHFVETNELPKCDYMAPADGLYKIKGNIQLYRSPAKKLSTKLGKAGDVAATGLIIGAMSLGALAMAPVTACALGVAGAAYGVGRSIGTLVDRSDHKQSIAPDNLESAASWLNIGTSAVTGLSAVGLANSTRIIAMSGKYSSLATSALKGLNYAALASSVFNFSAYLLYFKQRLENGEVTSKDLMELCVNMFLICGAVANVRQMHQHLTNLEVNAAQPKTLSKTAKRKLQRLRAKSRKAGQITPKADVMEVGALNTDMVQWSTTLSSMAIQMVLQRFPSANRIYSVCLDIVGTVFEFRQQKLTFKSFLSNIVNHVHNLYRIFKEDFESLKAAVSAFLRPYFGSNASPQFTNDVAAIVDNAVTSLNDTNEELPEVENKDESSSNENSKPKYEIILDEVTQRVYRMHSQGLHSRPIAEQVTDILQTFTKELASITRDITSQTQLHYNDILRFNSSILGEEKAKSLLSKIGINSKSDFADAAFEQTMDVVKNRSEIMHSIAKVYVDKVTALIREIFSIHVGKGELTKITAQETCEIFEKIVSLVLEPLTEDYTTSMKMYRTYAVLGGDRAVRMILEVFNLKKDDIECCREDDVTILNIALKKINRFEVISQLSVGSKATNSGSSDNEAFSDDFKIESLLSLCSSFWKKIMPMLDDFSRQSDMKKACFFIVHKFNANFQSLESEKSMKNISVKMKPNELFLGQRNFARICRFLNDTNKREVFDQVMGKFQQEEMMSELIVEYFQEIASTKDVKVEVWKNIVSDGGIKIYTIEITRCASVSEYTTMAAHLFNLREYDLSLVSRTEDLVILKSCDKYIMFEFVENENMALVMQVDLAEATKANLEMD